MESDHDWTEWLPIFAVALALAGFIFLMFIAEPAARIPPQF
jgi:hypothetical protein